MKLNSTQLRVTLFFLLLLLSGITGFAAKPPLKKGPIAAALPPTYCSAGVDNSNFFEYISSVTFNGTPNNSGDSGYGDYTNIIFNATRGSSNTLIINLANSYALDKGLVWVDWNQDGDFNDVDESILLTVSSGAGPYNGTVNVPVTAVLGQTRMRIRMNDDTDSNACGNSNFGEVEDYTINVLPVTYCAAQAQASYEYISAVTFSGVTNTSGGTTYSNFTNIVFNALRGSVNPIAINVGNGFFLDNGFVWVDWNQDGDFDDADESIALDEYQGIGPYNGVIIVPETALVGPTRMRVLVTDNTTANSCGNFFFGEVEDYTINVTQLNYCSAGVTQANWESIANVNFNGVSNSSGGSGYVDNTHVVFNAGRGSANALSITYNFFVNPNAYSTVYFDWNQDGDFEDASEALTITPVHPYNGSSNVVVNVPGNAALGKIRMRVRVSDGPITPCGTTPYGEVEDYTINVTDRRYIKEGATGDGLTWATASGDLQAMINASSAYHSAEVWVAAGNYQPAIGQYFTMKKNVKMYGGFPVTGNPMMADRNYAANVTQLLGNGNSVIINDNNRLTNTAVLDGFTIANGSSPTNGGGIQNINAYPLLQNCVFKNNTAPNDGGGLYNEGNGTTKVVNCLFYNNQAVVGGAVCDFGATTTTTYINCTFSNNTAELGGAIGVSINAAITGYNCIIWGNTANTIGAEIYAGFDCYAEFFNSIIRNPAVNVVGGGYTGTNIIDANPQFVNATGSNYSLKGSSPAINAGSNAYYTNAATAKDLANNPRLYNNATIDIGAYEYQGLADCSVTTTWNGTAWSNGTPSSVAYIAIIEGDYSSTGNITACSLTVNTGIATVNAGHNFIIKNAVVVNGGSLTFNNDANLVQEENVANTGNITYKRNSNALHYLDYTLWSSPVSGTQTLKEFSDETLDDRFYVYNTTANAFSNYTSASGIFGSNPDAITFTKAKGYLIRMPAGLSTTQTSVFNGAFIGVPNNGDISIALGTGGNRFNAVGNPYPSPINIFNFIDANNTQLDNGTIYLWRKTNNSANPTYATVTKLAYNANSGEGGDVAGSFTGATSDWVIKAGQGFFVKAATTATSLSFTNSMRRAVNTGPFFRVAQDADDTTHDVAMSRFWLDINNTAGAFGQTVIGYTDATTKQLDYGWDGRLLNDGEIALYSVAENTKLAIQARDAFAATDAVPMGYKATVAGNLTISLNKKDGLFAEGQNIYLIDKTAGITHEISASPYTFTTEAGTFDNRFDIVYTNGTLGIDKPVKNDAGIVVYKNDNKLHITATVTLKEVSVFDMRGRLLYTADAANSTEHVIQNLNITQQAIIIQIKTDDGTTHTKKTVY